MDERADAEPLGGYLPPEPTGREPDLGPGVAPPHAGESSPGATTPSQGATTPPHGQGIDYRGFLPPARAVAQGWPQPPQQAAGMQDVGSGWTGWQQAQSGPAGAAWQRQPTGWGQGGGPAVPDNGDAVAGLILSISAATLLLLSVGMSTIISVICAALGIYYSRKGRARVERGETPKHRGVAQAGFVTGIVALVLSVLMTIIWVSVVILYATDEGFRQDLEDELDGDDDGSPDGFETAIPLSIQALRIAALLLR